MSIDTIKNQLSKKYPGKQVIENKDQEGNVIEVLCEIEPTADHPEYSFAVAVANKSTPHKHVKAKEYYKVIAGTLTVYIDEKKHVLGKGEEITILPGSVHYVEGNETWFECKSEPGWTMEDHILV